MVKGAPMKPSETIKPISYLKAHASEIINAISENRKTIIVTQNGEAKVVVQDIRSYEENQESLALLKMLAMSSSSIQRGKHKSIKQVSRDIKARLRTTV